MKRGIKFLSALLLIFCLSHVAFCDENTDQGAKKFPNKLQATPPPDDEPHSRITSVPAARSRTTGSAQSPDNGSAMGLGISIPLGRPKKTPPTKQEKPEVPEDQSAAETQ